MAGVPCSLLGPLITQAEASGRPRYVATANEGDAVAVSCGAYLGGASGAVLMQNSGLGNAVNPLTSLSQTFQIPGLLLISLRGDPEGPPDQPQHKLMGRITGDLLKLMEIPWEFLEPDSFEGTLDRAFEASGPFALLVRSGVFAKGPAGKHRAVQRSGRTVTGGPPRGCVPRPDFLKELLQSTDAGGDLLVATTGHTGRELAQLLDRDNHFYMVGSMGCASSLGLGLALTRSDKRVLVLDGDAALTMRLGSLACIGRELPANLIHLVFDNGTNQSTGGQLSPSEGIDFCALALASGYRRAQHLEHPSQLAKALEGEGPALLQVAVLNDSQAGPPRPQVHPRQVAQRFRALHR